MKLVLFLFLFISTTLSLKAQSAETFFNESAKLYINDHTNEALSKINKALKVYPENDKLQSLKTLLENKQNKQKQDQQDNKEKKDSGKEGEENKNEQEKESNSQQQDGINKGENGSGSSTEELNRNDNSSKPNLSPHSSGTEKTNYKHLLKALKKQEKNTQRKLLRSKTRALGKRNQKDW